MKEEEIIKTVEERILNIEKQVKALADKLSDYDAVFGSKVRSKRVERQNSLRMLEIECKPEKERTEHEKMLYDIYKHHQNQRLELQKVLFKSRMSLPDAPDSL